MKCLASFDKFLHVDLQFGMKQNGINRASLKILNISYHVANKEWA